MEEKVILLAMKVLFLLLGIFSLFSLFKPDFSVNAFANYFKLVTKLYGFETEIKPTPKAKTICRIWNLITLFLFVILIIMLSLKY